MIRDLLGNDCHPRGCAAEIRKAVCRGAIGATKANGAGTGRDNDTSAPFLQRAPAPRLCHGR